MTAWARIRFSLSVLLALSGWLSLVGSGTAAGGPDLQRLAAALGGHGVAADGRIVSRAAGTDVVYEQDFNGVGGVGAEWSIGAIDTSPTGEGFLGRFTNRTVTLGLSNLPAHETLTLRLDFYVIGSWDGNDPGRTPDLVSISAGDRVLKTTTFAHGSDPQAFPGDYPGGDNPALSGSRARNSLGYTDSVVNCSGGNCDSTYELVFTFRHAADSVSFDISASGLDGDLGQESWGIDNVVVRAGSETCNTPEEPKNGGLEIVGTNGDDTLTGTPGDDIICGLDGNDTIFGRGGNDILLGGPGNDVLHGQEGRDQHIGGPDNDKFRDRELPEVDVFVGGPGQDTLIYNGKLAAVTATLGGVGGESGEGDLIRGSVEHLWGTEFDDRLTGNGRRNTLRGLDGGDTLRGGGRGDLLEGGPGNDNLFGQQGNDRLLGNRGEDLLIGGRGRDIMFGDQDNDCVQARDGRRDKRINGGPGQDELANHDPADTPRIRLFELQTLRGRCPR